MATRKTHYVETEQAAEVACGQPVRGRTRTLKSSEVTCPACEQALDQAAEARPEATTAPPAVEGKLEGDALIERKRLAGAGRSQEAGTAFGSRWTPTERERLQELYSEHGRSAAVGVFVREHPHRTAQGALYQIERNLSKRRPCTSRWSSC